MLSGTYQSVSKDRVTSPVYKLKVDKVSALVVHIFETHFLTTCVLIARSVPILKTHLFPQTKPLPTTPVPLVRTIYVISVHVINQNNANGHSEHVLLIYAT